MIKFGTSGWRAIIADEFAFAAVRCVTQGIANYLQAEAAKKAQGFPCGIISLKKMAFSPACWSARW
jgi:phosphomannomutase